MTASTAPTRNQRRHAVVVADRQKQAWTEQVRAETDAQQAIDADRKTAARRAEKFWAKKPKNDKAVAGMFAKAQKARWAAQLEELACRLEPALQAEARANAAAAAEIRLLPRRERQAAKRAARTQARAARRHLTETVAMIRAAAITDAPIAAANRAEMARNKAAADRPLRCGNCDVAIPDDDTPPYSTT